MRNRIVLIFALLLSPVVAFATVTGTATNASFTCTGSTGPFPFTFPIDTAAAMTVVQNGAVLAPGNYTVAPVNNNYDNGGSVTLNTACPTGQMLFLQRVTPITQLTQFTPYMPAMYANIEDGLDQLTEIDQEQESVLSGIQTTITDATCPAGQVLQGILVPTCVPLVVAGGGCPTTGCTFTGALNGTSASFSGTVAAGTALSSAGVIQSTGNAGAWSTISGYRLNDTLNSGSRNWLISSGAVLNGALVFRVSPSEGTDPGGGGTTMMSIDRSGNIINANGSIVIPYTALGYNGPAAGYITGSISGSVTLVSGTATVSTTAACAVGTSCNYSLTNCSKNASAGIGTLSVGTISAGTSFVINSLSPVAAVLTTDASTVCWQIN